MKFLPLCHIPSTILLGAAFSLAGTGCGGGETSSSSTGGQTTTTSTGGQGGQTTTTGGGGGGTTSSTGGGGTAEPSCSPLWSLGFTGTMSQAYVSSIVTDAGDNVYVGGYFTGDIDTGGGVFTSDGVDSFVVKLDSQGKHLWSKHLGGSGHQYVGIAADGLGGIVMTGQFQGSIDLGVGPIVGDAEGDAFVARLDGTGALLWGQIFVGPGAQGPAVAAVSASGNIVVSGVFEQSIDMGSGPVPSAGGRDGFIALFEPAGDVLWGKVFGDADEQEGCLPAFDAIGNVLCAGFFQGVVDLGGGPLVSAGSIDVLVAKLDAVGNHVWSHRYGDADAQGVTSIAVGPVGEVYLGGMFAGSVDFGGGALTSNAPLNDVFVAALDAAGQPLFSRSFATDGYVLGATVALSPGGDLFGAGSFSSTLDLGIGVVESTSISDIDGFLVRMTGEGSPTFGADYGDGAVQAVHAIHAASSGDVFAAGIFGGSIDFGSGPLTNSPGVPDGEVDVFVTRLSCTP